MPLARKLFATSMIGAACAVSAMLLSSGTAAAEPAPPAPAIPGMPSVPFLNGISPANAPAMLQGLASAFTNVPAATAPSAPAAPAPAATASVTLPQAPTVPAATAPAPAATAPAAPTSGLIPSADVTLPQVPGNPMQLPKQVSFPGDLASLMPPGLPLANLLPAAPAAAPTVAAPAAVAPAAVAPAVTAPATSPLGLVFPTSALP